MMDEIICEYCSAQGSILIPHFDENGEWIGDEYQCCEKCCGKGYIEKEEDDDK